MKQESDTSFQGPMLWITALVLTAGNFVAILDSTIANVSVAHIAGALGASNSQGTWVITSYAVAEAITVPLTGWLTRRFGTVRVFRYALIAFGIGSAMCGLAHSLGFLIFSRVLQGFAGGPLMPLSLTLLLRIFPKNKAATANGLWATTTLVAPVVGPILGGWLCDEYTWPWIFYINVPIAIICGLILTMVFRHQKEEQQKHPIDKIGLLLLVIWVSALQIMMDEGKDKDWFASNYIITLAIIAAIGFAAFMIWEITQKKDPIVNLSVFRHRGFSASVLTLSLAFAAFFGINVLTPLWLQTNMAYTATWAGLATAWTGVSALIIAPFVGALSARVDGRKLVFFGVLWMGAVTFIRSFLNTDVDFWTISIPLLVMGFGLPFFMIPISAQAMMSVEPHEMDSAAGLMNFLRTLSGAFATSLVNTVWENQTHYKHEQLSVLIDSSGTYFRSLTESGIDTEVARGIIDQITTSQSVMLATNDIMLYSSVAFAIAAFAIWLGPSTRKH